jgi:hypothetical protein
MKRVLLCLTVILLTAACALAAENRWLHVKVEDGGEKAEIVRINLPLSLAEKVLPAIHTKELHEGKVKVSEAKFEDVDLRAILDALRTAPENEFVTVQSKNQDVRVAKSGGNLLVRVRDEKEAKEGKEGKEKVQNVEVTIPFTVVDALLSGGKDELDVLAAVRALGTLGDTVLVTVNDEHSKVRIWVDSRNTAD